MKLTYFTNFVRDALTEPSKAVEDSLPAEVRPISIMEVVGVVEHWLSFDVILGDGDVFTIKVERR